MTLATILNASQPITLNDGTMEQAFRDYMRKLQVSLPLNGNGSPEGIINAFQYSIYLDDAATAPILYIKMLANIGGDVTKGWQAIDSVSSYNAYAAKTSAYTLTDADYCIDCTANTFTVTLPTAVGRAGRRFCIKNSGSGTITLDADGSEVIDAATTKSLAQWVSVIIISDGAGWLIEASH